MLGTSWYEAFSPPCWKGTSTMQMTIHIPLSIKHMERNYKLKYKARLFSETSAKTAKWTLLLVTERNTRQGVTGRLPWQYKGVRSKVPSLQKPGQREDTVTYSKHAKSTWNLVCVKRKIRLGTDKDLHQQILQNLSCSFKINFLAPKVATISFHTLPTDKTQSFRLMLWQLLCVHPFPHCTKQSSETDIQTRLWYFRSLFLAKSWGGGVSRKTVH